MQKNPIGWVEIPVTDLNRAEKFYTDYFGFEMARQPDKDGYKMSFFPMDLDGYGSGAMLTQGEDHIPSHEGTVVYFTAPEGRVDVALEKAEKMDIKIIAPKMAIGENGFMATIEDSEGNSIALHSMEG